jgi:hypothetical protein
MFIKGGLPSFLLLPSDQKVVIKPKQINDNNSPNSPGLVQTKLFRFEVILTKNVSSVTFF